MVYFVAVLGGFSIYLLAGDLVYLAGDLVYFGVLHSILSQLAVALGGCIWFPGILLSRRQVSAEVSSEYLIPWLPGILRALSQYSIQVAKYPPSTKYKLPNILRVLNSLSFPEYILAGYGFGTWCVYLVGVFGVCSWFVYFVRVGGCTWWVYFGVLWLLNLVYLLARFGILAAWIWCTWGTWCIWWPEFGILQSWHRRRRNNEENGAAKYPDIP